MKKKANTIVIIALLAAVTLFSGCVEEEAGVVTLRYWHTHSAVEMEKMETLVGEWEENHTNIKVEIELVPYDLMFQKMITLLAAGQVPCDLARYDIIYTCQLADLGVLTELSDLAEEAGLSEDDFYAGPWESCVWEDGLYGLPLDTCTRILFYRKDLLAAEGVSVPTTWDELRSVASNLTKDLDNDGVTDQWGFFYESAWPWHYHPFLWQAGGSEASPDMKTSTLNSTEAVTALQFLLDLMYVDKVSPPFEGWKWGVEALSKGEAAMIVSGPWGWSLAESTFGLDVEEKLGVATLPAGPAGEASVLGGQNLIMPKFTENPEEAMELAKFFMSDYYQTEMLEVEVFSPIKALAQSEVIAGNPLWATHAEQMKTARARLVHPKYGEMKQIIHKYLEEAFAQVKTAQEALDAIVAEINVLLKEEE